MRGPDPPVSFAALLLRHALAGLGRCALAAGQPTQAAALLRQALEIFQRIGAAEAPEVRTELDDLG